MKQKSVIKLSPLAGAMLMALSSPFAMAAVTPPPANSLPGAFSSNTSGVTYSSSSTIAATITVNSGATVLQWGGSTLGNTVAAPSGITTNPGFDIGTGATLTISNSAADASSVLLSDQTGNPSQIYGTLTATGSNSTTPTPPSLFVANANGVIVGNSAVITLPTGGGFIGENVNQTSFTGGTIASGTGTGDVTISSGSTINNSGYLLVAGNGNVNVGAADITGTISVVAGFSFTAAGLAPAVNSASTYNSNSSAVATLGTSATVYAAGNAFLTGDGMTATLAAVNGNLVNSGSAIIEAGVTLGGSFTNNGNATLDSSLAVSGAATNNGTLNQGYDLTAGSIVNNGTVTDGYNLTATSGTIVNNGKISAGTNSLTLLADATSGGGIVNNSTIENLSILSLEATSGNISNTGTLDFSTTGGILSVITANGDVTLNGNVTVSDAALSATNSLDAVTLTASGGALNLGTMLYTSNGDTLSGNSVQVTSGGLIDAASLDVTAASGNVILWQGTTLAAPTVNVSAGSTGNLILAGQLGNKSTNTINVTAANVIAGANTIGSFNVASGSTLNLDVYGNVVNQNGGTAAAINYAKYVPVNAGGSKNTVTINLNPENAGSQVQYINLGVNGAPTLLNGGNASSPITVGTANGNNISNYPFGALTLQATGDIYLGNTNTPNYYFPGQLRFANVSALSYNSFTLGTGTITLEGNLSNAVTSQIAGSGGISFLTNSIPTIGGNVVTNTNAWINFPAGTGLSEVSNSSNPAKNIYYGLAYKNGVFTTQLAGGSNTANKFNSVTMP